MKLRQKDVIRAPSIKLKSAIAKPHLNCRFILSSVNHIMLFAGDSSEQRESTDISEGEDNLFGLISPPLMDFLSDSLLNTPEASSKSSPCHRRSANSEASLKDDCLETATRGSGKSVEKKGVSISKLHREGVTEANQAFDPVDSPSTDKLVAAMERAILGLDSKMAPAESQPTICPDSTLIIEQVPSITHACPAGKAFIATKQASFISEQREMEIT